MATIWRALVTATLLLWGYVVLTGWQAGAGAAERAWHLQVGLLGSLLAALVQSLPFAYFLGTGFWVKAFVRASNAGPDWEQRQRLWMKGRAYPALYLAPLLTLSVAVTGSLADTGRVPAGLHVTLVWLALGAQVLALLLVPAAMARNSALMDELAERHRVPRPDTPEMQAYVAREEASALPPLFQLSRVLMFFAVQSVFVWLYLRFGTEGGRGVPWVPFAAAGALLLTVGLGLNARYDPERPASPRRAWSRAIAVGAAALLLGLWLGRLG